MHHPRQHPIKNRRRRPNRDRKTGRSSSWMVCMRWTPRSLVDAALAPVRSVCFACALSRPYGSLGPWWRTQPRTGAVCVGQRHTPLRRNSRRDAVLKSSGPRAPSVLSVAPVERSDRGTAVTEAPLGALRRQPAAIRLLARGCSSSPTPTFERAAPGHMRTMTAVIL